MIYTSSHGAKNGHFQSIIGHCMGLWTFFCLGRCFIGGACVLRQSTNGECIALPHPIQVHWCRFKRLCQRTSFKNILYTMANQHQRWLAYKFSMDLIDVKHPFSTELLTEAIISNTKQSALFKALLRAMMCLHEPMSLQLQYFKKVSYQGFLYCNTDCYIAWHLGSQVSFGKLHQIIRVACDPAPLWVLACKRLPIVEASAEQVGRWQVVLNIVKEGGESDKSTLVCLQHSPIRPVKFCPIAHDLKAAFDY